MIEKIDTSMLRYKVKRPLNNIECRGGRSID
jgi:hypothetical protein